MRLNRHALLRRHKRKLKERYGYGLYNGYVTNLKLHEDECREKYGNYRGSKNGGYEYWHHCYLSGSRGYAKSCTNRRIRAMYRDMLRSMDEETSEDIQPMRGADYEKAFDYDWVIW